MDHRSREKRRECGDLDENTAAIEDLGWKIEESWEGVSESFEAILYKISDLEDAHRSIEQKLDTLERLMLPTTHGITRIIGILERLTGVIERAFGPK